MAHGHGGAREGAGAPAGPRNPERQQVRLDFETERARHEKIKADERELELEIRRGNYLPRDVQRTAAATMLAVVAQSMRSLADSLERQFALQPQVAEAISVRVDEALEELAQSLKKMTRDA